VIDLLVMLRRMVVELLAEGAQLARVRARNRQPRALSGERLGDGRARRWRR
jgi:hypothetical protein